MSQQKEHSHGNELVLRPIGIDTYRENIVYMHADCHVCRSEGFTALTKVVVHWGEKSIIASLNVVRSAILGPHEMALSVIAKQRLGASDGDRLMVSHMAPIISLGHVRAKIYGSELNDRALQEIIGDVTKGRYSNVELAAFLVACSGDHLSESEVIGLTKAMIACGKRLDWGRGPIMDKHCVGGLPGNRTTPIVVSIAAAAGLTIPKTSSRAITSPAGTADAMETMAPVDLDLGHLRRVVDQEGGCIAWGGGVDLSPADDILISVEKALDIDSVGQMIASVLSKKAAAGSTHVVIDIPVGATAKVRSQEEAHAIGVGMEAVARAIGLQLRVILSDGSQPVGMGIGPALEAHDVLSVLRNDKDAPRDLRERALTLVGVMLEMAGKCTAGSGIDKARSILDSAEAMKKFMAICEAQGGFTEPGVAPHRYDVLADHEGVVRSVDNRRLARIAKLAGAPKAPTAGIRFHAPIGKHISKGELLFTIHAEAQGELDYAIAYMKQENGTIQYD